MVFRRAVFYAQFALSIVLPGWVLVSQSARAGIGWNFLAVLVVSALLFAALAVIAGVILARKSVRVAKAVSWPDAGLLLAIWASLLVYGVIAASPIVALVIALLVALFWVAVWELVTETRRRVRGFVDDLALTQQRPRTPGKAGPVIVIPPPAVGADDGSR